MTQRTSKGHSSRYLLLREQAVAALVLHGASEKAARSIGIAVRTYRNWMGKSDFIEAVAELRQQFRAGVLAQLTGMLQQAVEGLKREAESAPKSADRTREIGRASGRERRDRM